MQRVEFIVELLKDHPQANDFPELLKRLHPESFQFNTAMNIASLWNNQMIWNVARDIFNQRRKIKSLYDLVNELPEELEDTMSPRHSAYVFLGWCAEQGMNPHRLHGVFYALLKNSIYKCACIYLQGQSNSGKTTFTSNLFKPLEELIGRVSNDTFPFQQFKDKRIIIGEEIAVTVTNKEDYKALMSGSKVMVARKNRPPGLVQPELVLINTNVPLTHNLSKEDMEPFKSRLFTFLNLKSSDLLSIVQYGLGKRARERV